MFILVERRRRDKINAWIETLAKLIPDCSDDIKLNEVGLFVCSECVMICLCAVCDDELFLFCTKKWMIDEKHNS